MLSDYPKVSSSFNAPHHVAALETRRSTWPETNVWYPMCCRLIDRTSPIREYMLTLCFGFDRYCYH